LPGSSVAWIMFETQPGSWAGHAHGCRVQEVSFAIVGQRRRFGYIGVWPIASRLPIWGSLLLELCLRLGVGDRQMSARSILAVHITECQSVRCSRRHVFFTFFFTMQEQRRDHLSICQAGTVVFASHHHLSSDPSSAFCHYVGITTLSASFLFIYAHTSSLATLGSWSLTMAALSTHVLMCTCSYFALRSAIALDTNM